MSPHFEGIDRMSIVSEASFMEDCENANAVAWSPDGVILAAGCADAAIRVWDTRSARQPIILSGHLGPVKSVAWCPQVGTHVLASSDMNGDVRLWDLHATPVSGWITGGHRDLVRALSWSPDGSLVASGSDDLTIRLWDRQSRELELSLGGPAMNDVERVLQKMKLQAESQIILVHGAAPGQAGHQDYVTALAWAPDGATLASGAYDLTVRLWRPDQQASEYKVLRFSEYVFALTWPPVPGLLTVGEEHGRISIWESGEEAVAWEFNSGCTEVSSIAWAPDGTMIAVASHVQDQVTLWTPTGETLGSLPGHPGGVHALAWSSDGRLASAGQDGIRVWDRFA